MRTKEELRLYDRAQKAKASENLTDAYIRRQLRLKEKITVTPEMIERKRAEIAQRRADGYRKPSERIDGIPVKRCCCCKVEQNLSNSKARKSQFNGELIFGTYCIICTRAKQNEYLNKKRRELGCKKVGRYKHTDTHHFCGTCQTLKPNEEFHTFGGGITTQCKACYNKYQRKYAAINKERVTVVSKEWRDKNADRLNAMWRKRRKEESEKLTDTYIKAICVNSMKRKGYKIKGSEINKDLILIKRIQLQNKRQLKDLSDEKY
jgi:hypothetical protein